MLGSAEYWRRIAGLLVVIAFVICLPVVLIPLQLYAHSMGELALTIYGVLLIAVMLLCIRGVWRRWQAIQREFRQ